MKFNLDKVKDVELDEVSAVSEEGSLSLLTPVIISLLGCLFDPNCRF